MSVATAATSPRLRRHITRRIIHAGCTPLALSLAARAQPALAVTSSIPEVATAQAVVAALPPASSPQKTPDASPPVAPPSIVTRGRVDIEAPLLLNGKVIGELDLSVDANGDGDLDAARFVTLLSTVLDADLLNAIKSKVAARPRVTIAELSMPPLVVVYDPASLELRVSLPAARMSTQTMSFRGYEQPDPSRFSPQAKVAAGVAIGVDQRFIDSGPDAGRAPLRVTTDAFATFGAFPGVTLRGGGLFTEDPGHGFHFERAQTRLTYDSFSDAVHYVVGEFSPQVSGFQGSAPMLGIGVGRDYAGIRPFENIRPSGRGGVTLDRPSTVIVEVNGIETRRLRLEPGRYQLTDLSSVSGANDVRLFVEDDLGRREVASAAFFTSTSMLDGGLTDFGAAIGKRESIRTEYGGPLTATGYVRHGIGGYLTLGIGGQYAAGDWQLDAEAVVGTPIGLFRAQGSASDVADKKGFAASLDWIETFTTGKSTWSFTILSSVFSRDFASPFDRTGRVNDQRWRIDARADWRRGDLGVTLVANMASTRTHSEQEGVDLTGYYNRGRLSYTATLGVEREGRGSWGPRALIGISLRLGSRATASVRADTKRGAMVGEISRYPVDEVGDWSGRLQVSRDADRLGLTGEARYFGNRFIANLDQDYYSAQSSKGIATRETDLRVSTFIGFADGALAIGRPTPGNFAIYPRHSSLDGSKVVVRDESGYVVGKQDFLGSALVPFNRAFSPVYETYDVDPLPLGYDLGEGRLAAFPGAFSGYRVQVGSDDSRAAVGYLIAPGGPVANFAGTVEKVGDAKFGTRNFFTNDSGRFAVDRLSAGNYVMRINGVEVARFTIVPKSEGLVDVGQLPAKAP
jgi:outer membrane usher protein FimD/PapC